MENTDNPNRELVRAQRTCFIACLCMYLVVALNVLIGVVYLYALTQTRSLDFLSDSQSLRSMADILFGIVFSAMLAEFLRHFSRDNPFEKSQSARLFVSGVALALRTILGALNPVSPYETNVAGLGATVTSQADVDLKVVAMIVFLISLSVIVRYGDALKQDSDSIL